MNSKNKLKWTIKYSKPHLIFLISIVLLGALLSLSNIYKAIIMKILIDNSTSLHINKVINNLIFYAIIILADLILQAVLSMLSTYSYSKMYNNIQDNIYSKLTKTSWIHFSKFHSGDILTRITSDVEVITNMITNILPNIISLSVLLFGSFILILSYNPLIGFISLLLSPIPLLITKTYSLKLKKYSNLIQEVESKFRSFLHESVKNMIIIKAFCYQENNVNQLINIQNDRLNLILSRNYISILNSTIFSAGSWLIFFLVFTWGTLHLSDGTTTFGTIMTLTQLISYIKTPFSGLSSSVPKVISAMASIDRLMQLEVLEKEKTISQPTLFKHVGIEFNNVSFGYNSDTLILNNISININQGETLALIGKSGEGKTTFIRLLLSLINQQSGKMYITHELEKHEIDASSRNLISYVPQGNTLFSGTIAENLKYGNEDASDVDLEDAVRSACAWDFISNLNEGLYTFIGEGGLGLSEGQAQRIAIARALLKKSPILILDEATSSLDVETEIKILHSIKHLNYSPTCIIITHRQPALEICNRIVKLENCNLIELDHTYTHATAM